MTDTAAAAPAEGAAPAAAPAGTAAAPPAAGTPTYAPPATQADLDAIIQARLAREQARFSDYDDLKTKAGELETIKASQLSDLEKAQAAQTAAEKKAADLETKFQANALRSSVVTEAVKAGAVNPDQVLALIDQKSLTVGDDGTVTGATEAVAAFLAANPHMVAAAGPVVKAVDGAGATGSTTTFTQAQVEDMSDAEYEKNRDAILASMATWK